MKSGGAYLPLDPAYPKARLEYILKDARPRVLLTQGELVSQLPEHEAEVICLDSDWPILDSESGENPAVNVADTDLAYLIYTSGSTGTPKAVMVEQRNLLNTILASQEGFSFSSVDVMPCLAASSFDISLFEMLNPLVAGGRLLLLSRENVLDMQRLVNDLDQMTVIHAVPSLMQQIVSFIKSGGSGKKSYEKLRMIFTGGDVVPPGLLEEMQEVFAHSEIVVLYGPTEGTIICSSYPVPTRQVISKHIVGRPLGNVTMRIYDVSQNLVPIGVAGEIYIGGTGVSRGYLNRADLTAEKFVTIEGQTFYKTGDMARFLPDGNIEFLGRLDHQVKIRGYRIELGEIGTILAQHPSVKEAIVIAQPDSTGDKRLVAYIVAKEKSLMISELRSYLSERLADYMLPSSYVMLDSFPLSQNGKLDRSKLPNPDGQRPMLEKPFQAPRNELERLLADTWQELLGIKEVGDPR